MAASKTVVGFTITNEGPVPHLVLAGTSYPVAVEVDKRRPKQVSAKVKRLGSKLVYVAPGGKQFVLSNGRKDYLIIEPVSSAFRSAAVITATNCQLRSSQT